MEKDKYLSILQRYWGYDEFRGIQREIIESISQGKDTLGLMPTGGGKSITFQVPALAMEGVCVVITPLIALMKDQVIKLKERGIRAVAIHAAMNHNEIIAVLESCIFGGYKILYVSPERLSSDLFITKFKHMKVSFITVDEAHCICQWGYDFRPSYLTIANIRKLKPEIPILALTATATPENIRDIQEKLLFKKENVFRMSFVRPNLAYQVYHTEESGIGMIHKLQSIPGSCIIYTRNRERCAGIAEDLCKMGYKATYYHAGLADWEKDERQQKWLRNEYRIIVCTNAFGMGIDKPDVRLVIHRDLPDSIEEYFQEAGRAGRDGKKSYAIIILDGKEIEALHKRLSFNFPKPEYIQDIYEKVCFFYQMAIGDGQDVTKEFNIEKFCRTFRFHPLMAKNALQILDRAGYIEYTDEEEGESRLIILATRKELYRDIDETRKKIVNCLLRNFPGLFLTYVFLDEEFISKETGLKLNVIFCELNEMRHAGIINYIPKKKIPKITFKKKRVDKESIILSEEVYQAKKNAYQKRLEAMEKYCMENSSICRSKTLLEYFGEKQEKNCGLCDVCQREESYKIGKEEVKLIKEFILKQLSTNPIPIYELEVCGIDEYKLHWVFEEMRAKEEFCYKDGMIWTEEKNIL